MICSLKQIQLHILTNISSISENAAVMIFIFDIFKIIDIVNTCFCQVKGMDNST